MGFLVLKMPVIINGKHRFLMHRHVTATGMSQRCHGETMQFQLFSYKPTQVTKSNILITNTHTHPFNGPLSGNTRVSRYQKGTTKLDFTKARDSEWQWHQLNHIQVYTSLQTDNHASTPPLCFLQAGCPSCCPFAQPTASKHWRHNKQDTYIHTPV